MKIFLLILIIVWLWSNYKEKDIKNEQATGWRIVKKSIKPAMIYAIFCCIVWSVLALFFSRAGKLFGIIVVAMYLVIYLYCLISSVEKFILGRKQRNIIYAKYVTAILYLTMVFSWAIISIL